MAHEPTTCGYSGLPLDECKDANCNDREHIRDARSQGDRKWQPASAKKGGAKHE